MSARLKEIDARFAGIPPVTHSSVSGASSQTRDMSVGADEYVPKFEAGWLAQTPARLLA